MSNKLIRINLIKNIIKRWGPLDKGQIDQHLSNQLNLVLDNALKRAIYRDLDKLVHMNEINIHYFDKDDCEIDFESIPPKTFYKNKWSIEEKKKIQGEGILKELGCNIASSDILIDEVAVFNSLPHVKSNERIILITTLSTPIYIKIKLDLCPIKVRFTRQVSEEIKEARTIYIRLNDNTISADHLELIFNHQSYDIIDLNSKNGSFLRNISQHDLESLIQTIEKTKTVTAQSKKKFTQFSKHNSTVALELKIGLSTHLVVY